MKIILASKSPRRKELLALSGLSFDVVAPDICEKAEKKFNIENIKNISYSKALNVAEKTSEDAIIISADTIVILKNVCLYKPHNFNEAFILLKNLSGKTHNVISAICVYDTKTSKFLIETPKTEVTFRKLDDDEIASYINNFKPYDKAGSYGIQDFVSEKEVETPPKSSFISKIEGDYENVMGISTKTVLKMLDMIQSI